MDGREHDREPWSLCALLGLLLAACAVQVDPGRAGFPCNPDGSCRNGLTCVGGACAVDDDRDGSALPDDCDDADPAVHPGAAELCGDGIDQDCSGADAVCPACTEGELVSCYPLGLDHPSMGVAPCGAGGQRCEGGALGPCEGAVVPEAETCNGVDDDCDGEVDPGCCEPGTVQPCGALEPVGACAPGVQVCGEGGWGACLNEAGPRAERCNGLDDDCDGETDEAEDLVRTWCPLTLGVCGPAVPPCVAGAPAECDAGVYGADYEVVETRCDLLDNDCDGLVDEGCACTGQNRKCFGYGLGVDDPAVAVGPCILGRQRCEAAGWGACTNEVIPTPEACNGLDDDCNGVIDDVAWLGDPCVAADRVGACRDGRLACAPLPNADGRVCLGDEAVPDLACDGVDADCDGSVTPADDVGDAPCPDEGACCPGGCRDLAQDPASCGDCGHVCTAPECQVPLCEGGLCVTGDLPEGTPCTPDADPCTEERCLAGSCVPGPAPDGLSCGAGCECRSGGAVELDCGDGFSNDGDPEADCADPDCQDQVCGQLGEVCTAPGTCG